MPSPPASFRLISHDELHASRESKESFVSGLIIVESLVENARVCDSCSGVFDGLGYGRLLGCRCGCVHCRGFLLSGGRGAATHLHIRRRK